jgi:polysaccharide export outer membrane protein
MKTMALALSALTFFGSMPVFPAEPAPVPAPADKEYYIAAGDVINVSVFPAEEFSKEVTVQPDGTIEIPLLGSIKARGMKAEELQNVLTAKFSKYVANPSITLNVRKFSSNRVAVIGQINTPGYYEYKEGMRLLDLVAVAGGPQDWAKAANVRVYRRAAAPGEQQQVLTADLEGVLAGKMDKNIPLANGDIVYIPRRSYSKAAKWISDNFLPWATLFTFGITIGIVARKN